LDFSPIWIPIISDEVTNSHRRSVWRDMYVFLLISIRFYIGWTCFTPLLTLVRHYSFLLFLLSSPCRVVMDLAISLVSRHKFLWLCLSWFHAFKLFITICYVHFSLLALMDSAWSHVFITRVICDIGCPVIFLRDPTE
jgi:hypothetical protein